MTCFYYLKTKSSFSFSYYALSKVCAAIIKKVVTEQHTVALEQLKNHVSFANRGI